MEKSTPSDGRWTQHDGDSKRETERRRRKRETERRRHEMEEQKGDSKRETERRRRKRETEWRRQRVGDTRGRHKRETQEGDCKRETQPAVRRRICSDRQYASSTPLSPTPPRLTTISPTIEIFHLRYHRKATCTLSRGIPKTVSGSDFKGIVAWVDEEQVLSVLWNIAYWWMKTLPTSNKVFNT